MELIPPDSQDAANREAAAQSEDKRFQAGARRRRFEFDVTRSTRATVIRLAGELDVVCADSFKRRYAEATEHEPDHVVIDLRALTFIDSTGLALLLRVNEMSRDRGVALWVVSSEHDPASKIFRMTGTNTILPLVDHPPDFGAGTT